MTTASSLALADCEQAEQLALAMAESLAAEQVVEAPSRGCRDLALKEWSPPVVQKMAANLVFRPVCRAWWVWRREREVLLAADLGLPERCRDWMVFLPAERLAEPRVGPKDRKGRLKW